MKQPPVAALAAASTATALALQIQVEEMVAAKVQEVAVALPPVQALIVVALVLATLIQLQAVAAQAGLGKMQLAVYQELAAQENLYRLLGH